MYYIKVINGSLAVHVVMQRSYTVPRAAAEEQGTFVSVNGAANGDGQMVDFDELTDLIR